MRRLIATLLGLVSVASLAFGSAADIASVNNPAVGRAWPTGPRQINRTHPLGDACILIGVLPSGQWYNFANGQYAMMQDVYDVNLGGATGGTYTLSWNGNTSTAIAFGATQTTIQPLLGAFTGAVGVQGGVLSAGHVYVSMWPMGLGAVTANFASLTGATNPTVTLVSDTLPKPTAPDASWRWAPALAADLYPGSVYSGNMQMAFQHLMGVNASANPNGHSYAIIVQPANTTSSTTRMGDGDFGDGQAFYVNRSGHAGAYSVTCRDSGNSSQLDDFNFPTSYAGVTIPWTMMVRSKSPNNGSASQNALIWGNYAVGGTLVPYMVSQVTARTNCDATQSTIATYRISPTSTLPVAPPPLATGSRTQAKIAYFAVWPHPISIAQANQLYSNPWCMLAQGGN